MSGNQIQLKIWTMDKERAWIVRNNEDHVFLFTRTGNRKVERDNLSLEKIKKGRIKLFLYYLWLHVYLNQAVLLSCLFVEHFFQMSICFDKFFIFWHLFWKLFLNARIHMYKYWAYCLRAFYTLYNLTCRFFFLLYPYMINKRCLIHDWFIHQRANFPYDFIYVRKESLTEIYKIVSEWFLT